MIQRIAEIRRRSPDNLMARHFDHAYLQSLSPSDQDRLLRIVRTGLENPSSQMGAYAMQPDDYDHFKPYLDRLIRDYHGITGLLEQRSDWRLPKALDLTTIDPTLANTSMRVRVGRNLSAFPLPGAMTQDDRLALEVRMVQALEPLIADPRFAGSYRSLTPGSAFQISHDTYQNLVAQHLMFKDMSADPYLASAGISADWPVGRGLYVSRDEQLIVWIGEEDHLRIMAMRRGSLLNDIFDRLSASLETLASQGLHFATSDTYGYVTSCPTNLGTGMRASVHVALPHLTRGGQDVAAARAVASPLGLSIRGAGGEHTAAGAGGVVDVSPRARLAITEAEIAQRLYAGVRALWQAEVAATP